MASAEQLRNYLETLSIGPGSCQGFEDEALGACIGLVGWGTAGIGSRSGWMQAVTAASFNTSGTTTAGPANKSFFYVALRHRQNSAFGPFGFSTPDWNKFDVADFPWALPDPLFVHSARTSSSTRAGPTRGRQHGTMFRPWARRWASRDQAAH